MAPAPTSFDSMTLPPTTLASTIQPPTTLAPKTRGPATHALASFCPGRCINRGRNYRWCSRYDQADKKSSPYYRRTAKAYERRRSYAWQRRRTQGLEAQPSGGKGILRPVQRLYLLGADVLPGLEDVRRS